MFYIQIVISLLLIKFAQNSVIRNDDTPAESLYDDNDKVVVLTNENFYQSIFDQPYANNVEFYNSFCGFCRNFAPHYKKFAEDIYEWRDVIQVAAIDCANDANNDICRDMEVMKYPTLRYFAPYSRNDTNHLGIEIEHAPMTVGEPHLYQLMSNTSTAPSSWPNLKPVQMKSKELLFDNLPEGVDYIFLVYEPNNQSVVAQKVALDLRKINEIQVRQVASISVATNLGLKVQSSVYAGAKNTKEVNRLPTVGKLNRTKVREAIKQFLTLKGIRKIQSDEQLPVPAENIPSSSQTNIETASEAGPNGRDAAIIDYVKSHRSFAFQADVEVAIHYSLSHELVKYGKMNEEQITALKRYISILQKFAPLGDSGKNFLTDLNAYVENKSTLHGKELSETIKELESRHQPIYSSSKWVGCKPSTVGRRGFSCGLWTLFHYLSIQAANSERSHEPLEVLQAIHGYVKHFFGCTHCSEHFQEMAERNHIWSVKSKDEAVLWLWKAHNEVNQRLAGDQTEDPLFPKIQYPSREMCSQCYQQMIQLDQQSTTSNPSSVPQWNLSEVLYYLRRVYSPFNLNRFGVDDESVLPDMMNVFSSKLQSSSAANAYSNAFSEMDIRMGILLYAFCMLIIVIAVKLFLQRGYRKKIYTHDFLGKI